MTAGVTILWWRDIPAQVIVRAGRQTAKRELPLRFAEAIDMAAMRGGLAETDAYLEQWRRTGPEPCGPNLEQEAELVAAALDRDYARDRLKRLVESGGREPDDHPSR